MNTDLLLTCHAKRRQQQRGINAQALDLLMDYGKRVYDNRGFAKVFFDKRARKRVVQVLGVQAKSLKLDIYAVVDAMSERIITTGHLQSRVMAGARNAQH